MSLSQFYKSNEWEALVKFLRLERVNEQGLLLCAHCGKPIVKAYDCIGHHVIELTEENYNNADIALNPDNIVLVHHRCHNKIHNKLGYSQRQVFVVYGSPLSGKSSYVKETMVEGDLIIDMDRIWQCVSGCPEYVKPNRLKSVVFSARDNLLESVKYRRGKWLNAYVSAVILFKRKGTGLLTHWAQGKSLLIHQKNYACNALKSARITGTKRHGLSISMIGSCSITEVIK